MVGLDCKQYCYHRVRTLSLPAYRLIPNFLAEVVTSSSIISLAIKYMCVGGCSTPDVHRLVLVHPLSPSQLRYGNCYNIFRSCFLSYFSNAISPECLAIGGLECFQSLDVKSTAGTRRWNQLTGDQSHRNAQFHSMKKSYLHHSPDIESFLRPSMFEDGNVLL